MITMQNMAPLMFGGLVVVMLIGFPVAFSLAALGLFAGFISIELGFFPAQYLANLPLRIFGILSNDLLLAIPFFTFMGAILERCGLADRLLAEADIGGHRCEWRCPVTRRVRQLRRGCGRVALGEHVDDRSGVSGRFEQLLLDQQRVASQQLVEPVQHEQQADDHLHRRGQHQAQLHAHADRDEEQAQQQAFEGLQVGLQLAAVFTFGQQHGNLAQRQAELLQQPDRAHPVDGVGRVVPVAGIAAQRRADQALALIQPQHAAGGVGGSAEAGGGEGEGPTCSAGCAGREGGGHGNHAQG